MGTTATSSGRIQDSCLILTTITGLTLVNGRLMRKRLLTNYDHRLSWCNFLTLNTGTCSETVSLLSRKLTAIKNFLNDEKLAIDNGQLLQVNYANLNMTSN